MIIWSIIENAYLCIIWKQRWCNCETEVVGKNQVKVGLNKNYILELPRYNSTKTESEVYCGVETDILVTPVSDARDVYSPP